MDNTINQRVKEIIQHYKLNNNQFALKIGLERADKIHNITNGATGVSTEMLVLISKTFDNINVEWLLLGKGEMLKNANYNSNITPSIAKEPIADYKKNTEDCIMHLQRIKDLEYLVNKLEKMVDIYEHLLDKGNSSKEQLTEAI